MRIFAWDVFRSGNNFPNVFSKIKVNIYNMDEFGKKNINGTYIILHELLL